jgi:hypothetical protein
VHFFWRIRKRSASAILAWLGGCYKEEDEPPVINTEDLVSKAREARRVLRGASETRLIDSTDTFFQTKLLRSLFGAVSRCPLLRADCC